MKCFIMSFFLFVILTGCSDEDNNNSTDNSSSSDMIGSWKITEAKTGDFEDGYLELDYADEVNGMYLRIDSDKITTFEITSDENSYTTYVTDISINSSNRITFTNPAQVDSTYALDEEPDYPFIWGEWMESDPVDRQLAFYFGDTRNYGDLGILSLTPMSDDLPLSGWTKKEEPDNWSDWAELFF